MKLPYPIPLAKIKSCLVLNTNAFLIAVVLLLQMNVLAQKAVITEVDDTNLITNANFETGNMEGWKHWRTKFSVISKEAYSGNYAVQVGPERAFCVQELKVKSNSLYRISAYVKTNSGQEEIQFMVSDYGGAQKSVSSALTAYTKVSIDFQTAFSVDLLKISFIHPTGNGSGFADQLELTYLGEAPKPVLQ